ncbi:calcium-activated chloride channel regulator 1-like [Glandiceps talaboti]
MSYSTVRLRVLLFLCGVLASAARNQVDLFNNKYTTLLIAINGNITEDPMIVEILQDIYVGASEELYKATNQRAAFGEITILIPKTWSDNITTEVATTERFAIANVIVDDPNPDYDDTPYVKQSRPCGEKGEYLHLTEKWIVDRTFSEYNFGNSSKLLVHEWGHMQWGLYDEYAQDIDSLYYIDPNGRVEATRCSDAITGQYIDFQSCDHSGCNLCNIYPESGVIPDPWCVFVPDEPNEGTGSYMYANYLESVVQFCHSDPNGDPYARHNPLALTKQNEECRYRSAWDVMHDSTDFSNNNPPVDGLDSKPTFKLVKEGDYRTVIVMDLSGSMSIDNRVDIQHQAATKYIAFTLPNDSWVGIVQFSSSAMTLAPLTQIVDDETRQDLISLLPTMPGGSTCIGCGLREGVQVLENSPFGYAAGGILFLTTDGEENVPPYIDDVLPYLIEKEVIVDTLAFSEDADPKLVELSDETGGIACWYSEGDDSTALHDCFTASVTERTSSNTETPVQLASYKTTVAGQGNEISTIYIDSTIGRDTIFFFFWDFSSSHEVDVIITRPDGTTIDSTDPQYNSEPTIRSIFIKISDIAEVGEWTYQIYNPDTDSQLVQVSVDSKSIDPSTHPIRLSSNPSTDYVTESPPMAIIYADLNQGYSPVLEANVIATVERPSPHSVVDVQLVDSGTGADITKDDGVYSGYFVDFVEAICTNDCRYSIQVTADDEDDTAQIRMTSRVGAMPRNYTVIPRKEDGVPIGDFNRVVQGGMIQVNSSVEYVDWSDPNDDPFPPARIKDLRVTNTSYDNATVTLQWTATGDDFDAGTASFYDLRYDTNFGQLASNFDDCYQLTNDNLTDGTLTEPKESGETETVTVRLPSSGPGFTYYFSIRAIDDVGNAGQSSSIAQTTIVADPINTDIDPSIGGLEGWHIALIIVTVCLLCVGTIGVVIGLNKYYKKKKKTAKVEPSKTTEMETSSEMPHVTNAVV